MCGIVGIHDTAVSLEGLQQLAENMADVIAHRGPDDRGIWLDTNVPLALGHRRLSILDLSPAGHQPMLSHSGRYVMVYNGEVYNFREIACELNEPLVGGSDTEVLLAAIETWGLAKTLEKCIGMFALAVWDREQQTLQLARDRLGIKPLYYAENGSQFCFASELRPLEQHPALDTTIDRTALAMYMRYKYIGAPLSIYKSVRKLPPGTILQKRFSGDCPAELNAYWSLDNVASQGCGNRFDGTLEDAVTELQDKLSSSIALRMISDVPLGAFLSGGIDSSVVVALMQQQSSSPVRTFSIGFGEEKYNEAVYAKEVARHIGTEHTELYVSAEEVLRTVPLMPDIYDEPFADSSQIPTYLVSELTRKSVTVSLSGDGGDELFAGYPRYELCANYWNKLGRIPRPVRSGVYAMSKRVPPGLIDAGLYPLRRMSKSNGGRFDATTLLRRIRLAAADTPIPMFDSLMSKWDDAPSVVKGAELPMHPLDVTHTDLNTYIEQMMYIDQWSYLPGDILTKVDRASMAVSLEARVPLLDHRVVEFAWKLPLHFKIGEGETKLVLKRLLEKHVPRRLFDRPKKGFGVPLDNWLRGPLRDWADDLLNTARLEQDGYFDTARLAEVWSEHRAGKRNAGGALWNVLMFNAWLSKRR